MKWPTASARRTCLRSKTVSALALTSADAIAPRNGDSDPADTADSVDSDVSALVGFVVGRSIGPSVARHRVIRRLRHAVQRNVDELPPGSTTVIRALPTAATASWPALVADVTSGLHRVCRGKAGAR